MVLEPLPQHGRESLPGDELRLDLLREVLLLSRRGRLSPEEILRPAQGLLEENAAWPEVQGILSEDDTLFVATDNVFDSRLLLQRLKRLVKT
jgi:hypothetical protein